MNTYHIMNKQGTMESRTIHEWMDMNDPLDLIQLIAQRYEALCDELNVVPDPRWKTIMDLEHAAKFLGLGVDGLRRLLFARLSDGSPRSNTQNNLPLILIECPAGHSIQH
jgi:hypothetical protein